MRHYWIWLDDKWVKCLDAKPAASHRTLMIRFSEGGVVGVASDNCWCWTLENKMPTVTPEELKLSDANYGEYLG